MAAAAGIGGTTAHSWWAAPSTRLAGDTQLEGARSWLGRHGGEHRRLWTDPHTRKILAVYRQGPWGGRARDVEVVAARPGSASPGRGDLVLLYDAERGRVCPLCHVSAGAVWGDPAGARPGWHEVHASADRVVRMYEVR